MMPVNTHPIAQNRLIIVPYVYPTRPSSSVFPDPTDATNPGFATQPISAVRMDAMIHRPLSSSPVPLPAPPLNQSENIFGFSV